MRPAHERSPAPAVDVEECGTRDHERMRLAGNVVNPLEPPFPPGKFVQCVKDEQGTRLPQTVKPQYAKPLLSFYLDVD